MIEINSRGSFDHDQSKSVLIMIRPMYRMMSTLFIAKRPHSFQRYGKAIAHFRVMVCLCVKKNHSYETISMKNVFYLQVHFHENQTHFHMKSFACVCISRHQNCLNNDKVRKNSIKALSKMLEMNFTELYKHSKKDTYEIIE